MGEDFHENCPRYINFDLKTCPDGGAREQVNVLIGFIIKGLFMYSTNKQSAWHKNLVNNFM